MAPSAATLLYPSLRVLILISVSAAIFCYTEISVEVYFVTSSDSISSLLSRIVAGSASDKFLSKSDSSLAKVI